MICFSSATVLGRYGKFGLPIANNGQHILEDYWLSARGGFEKRIIIVGVAAMLWLI